MIVFAVIATETPAPKLASAITQKFPDNKSLQIAQTAWLVSADETSKGVSDSLGITTGETEAAVVIANAGYYGRASTHIWEWIKREIENRGG